MRNPKGFTLIELLVVIAIIGVLATGAVTVFSGATQKANDAARLADLSVVNSAINIFNADNSNYPDGTNRAAFVADMVPGYLQSVPSDPDGTTLFVYTYGVVTAEAAAPQSFELVASLEHAATNGAKMTTDGGDQTDHYEIGTDLTLLAGTPINGTSGAVLPRASNTATVL